MSAAENFRDIKSLFDSFVEFRVVDPDVYFFSSRRLCARPFDLFLSGTAIARLALFSCSTMRAALSVRLFGARLFPSKLGVRP